MKWNILVVLAICLNYNGAATHDRDLNDYKVIHAKPITLEQKQALLQHMHTKDVDFLSLPKRNSNYSTFMVSSEALKPMKQTLQEHHIPYNVTVSNVKRLLDSKKELVSTRWMSSSKNLLNTYFTFKEIENYIYNMKKNYPKQVKVEVVAYTHERRNIYLVKISPSGFTNTTAPITVFEAGMHAREWLAPATALYLMTKALIEPQYMNGRDWYIIPVANPDGYVYSHRTDRLWRKNRRPLHYGCIGVDCNRNFNVDFGRIGVSRDECGDTYYGGTAFSEIESWAVATVILKNKMRVTHYLALHSYGPYILIPFAYTKDKYPPHFQDMLTCAKLAKKAMDTSGPNNFKYGNTASLLYEASGGSDDWAVEKANIPYSYTVELQKGGSYGFDPPADRIGSHARLSFEGLVILASCTG